MLIMVYIDMYCIVVELIVVKIWGSTFLLIIKRKYLITRKNKKYLQMHYNSLMKFKKILFLPQFYFLLEIYNLIIKKKKIPILFIKMLSSRFSGKTHVIEQVFTLLLLQSSSVVYLTYVRARNENALEGLKQIEKILNEIDPNLKYSINKSEKIIKVGKNILKVETLNEEKVKVRQTGGKIGLSNQTQAEYILAFFEECSQLNEDLVLNYSHSLRGTLQTQIIQIFASNPWVRSNWFIEQFLHWLPESKQAEKELEEKGYNIRFDAITKTLYYRPRYTINRHIPEDKIREIEALKNINYNKWKIISLGFSGNLNGSIYLASLEKLNTKVENHIDHQYYGGVDWGDGKSAQGSATTAYFGGISIDYGIDIYAEYEWWNNKGIVLSTDQQISKICDFYIAIYNKIKQPISVAVDNAALGDFFLMFQQDLRRKGFFAQQIEFIPAFKPKNTWERVETVNALISMGVLRFNPQKCPGLFKALENCYEVTKLKPSETMKRERSHEYTHWIHALEYLIGPWMKDFQDKIPLFDNKSLGSYAII